MHHIWIVLRPTLKLHISTSITCINITMNSKQSLPPLWHAVFTLYTENIHIYIYIKTLLNLIGPKVLIRWLRHWRRERTHFHFMTIMVDMTAIWSLNSQCSIEVIEGSCRGERGSVWQDCDIKMICLSLLFKYTPPAWFPTRPCVSPLDKSFMSSTKCAFCGGDWNVNMAEELTALGLSLWL